ncbi:hypothetical protein HYPBUDRAFT_190433 [Hyphopichia burtonii NRRL Y-1933]|uniref:Uncharacterized protein n=1 Tax=Hyphopichia burtonii NRRL Y-1933 TaxID=984485 RepID=A0A1E4RN39_9ASCO|nr:hypothetical protein HYPBUDRAFT_190433 [Hyphopichia burtonii NRRL Y-1933]ODV68673.1 hypothetical protein HYPBUDRAFT_190433 [Hyphopichia burtonii NRRL Y-1933]
MVLRFYYFHYSFYYFRFPFHNLHTPLVAVQFLICPIFTLIFNFVLVVFDLRSIFRLNVYAILLKCIQLQRSYKLVFDAFSVCGVWVCLSVSPSLCQQLIRLFAEMDIERI